MKPIGISIPQYATGDIQVEAQLKDFELVVIPIPQGKLGLLGVVLGVEGYSAHPGEMTVYVSYGNCDQQIISPYCCCLRSCDKCAPMSRNARA